jgi:hypothetical protein
MYACQHSEINRCQVRSERRVWNKNMSYGVPPVSSQCHCAAAQQTHCFTHAACARGHVPTYTPPYTPKTVATKGSDMHHHTHHLTPPQTVANKGSGCVASKGACITHSSQRWPESQHTRQYLVTPQAVKSPSWVESAALQQRQLTQSHNPWRHGAMTSRMREAGSGHTP